MTPEDLVEIELIKRLKYKYARCLDQKLWDEIGECFTIPEWQQFVKEHPWLQRQAGEDTEGPDGKE